MVLNFAPNILSSYVPKTNYPTKFPKAKSYLSPQFKKKKKKEKENQGFKWLDCDDRPV